MPPATEQAAKDASTTSFLGMLNNTGFSDCKVICKQRVWHTHKFVLCQRSEWFSKALKGTFLVSIWPAFSALTELRLKDLALQEGQTGEVRLDDFDETDINRLLTYLYSGGDRE
jgi:hypothetical protein